MIDFLKSHWMLLAFVFQLGGAYFLFNDMRDDIMAKLSVKDFWHIRTEDSLKQVIREMQLQNVYDIYQIPNVGKQIPIGKSHLPDK